MAQEDPDRGIEPIGCSKKFRHLISVITVEPILLLFFLPYVMLILVNSNLFLEKSCRVNLKFNDSVCDGLTSRNSSLYTNEDEEKVHKLVASMNIWRSVIQSLLPIVFLSFMGSWSDKHKHLKPSLIFPVVGGVVKIVGLLISVGLFYQLNMEETGAIEVIPSSLLGSTPTMTMGVYNYVSAISTVKSRTLRLGIIGFTNFLSFTMGIVCGGVLLRAFGYYGIYSIALVMYISSIFYTVFLIKEVPNASKAEKMPWLSYLKDFLSFDHMLQTLTSVFKKREKNYQLRIVLSLILIVLVSGPQHGEIQVVYLFTRIRFQWSEVEFSLYYMYHLILNVIGLIISLFAIRKWVKLDDSILGIIGCSSKVLASVISAFAPNPAVFYVAVLVEMYSTISHVAVKSLVTKLVANEELGKVLSVVSIFETLPILIYGSLYSAVYNATINTLPGSFFLVGGGLTIPAVMIFFWLYLQHKKDRKEESQKD